MTNLELNVLKIVNNLNKIVYLRKLMYFIQFFDIFNYLTNQFTATKLITQIMFFFLIPISNSNHSTI